jgi:hypothetical protein
LFRANSEGSEGSNYGHLARAGDMGYSPTGEIMIKDEETSVNTFE